jgi:hypothetical protein
VDQLIEVVSDENAQQLLGGKSWNKNWGLDKLSKLQPKNSQTIFSPIRSSAVSIANAIAINISIFSINSPQIATATAVSTANSVVEGGTAAA